MKQKLVTVFLHDRVDGKKAYGDPAGNPLFAVSEHLESYLKEGWLVKNVQTMGAAGGHLSGWIVALLEKAY